MPSLRLIGITAVALTGCADDFDTRQWFPGGQTTNVQLLGNNAFKAPAANLSPEAEMDFFSGNGFFNQAWVEAPASTTARDGLGPLFNARSCSACHFRDGKGAPPEDGQGPFVGLLLRVSPPDEVYGAQIQDQATSDLPPEAIPVIETTPIEGQYADGTRYELAAPTYVLTELAYGPLTEGTVLSPRVAPHVIGLGLLEAIPEERLMALADPEDTDGDGISGRIQWLDTNAGMRIGRFGWKGDAPDVAEQTAGAFAGDMGLTSPLRSTDDCTAAQPECAEAEPVDPEEVEARIFDVVVTYSRTLAPPVRRAADDRTIRRGQAHFDAAGCTGCHVPSHETADEAALPALASQVIWPYTDLLLHDMGPELADNAPLGSASGSEWQTPPLWGLGFIEDVGAHTRFLHDGRARSLEEAILWHGGEAAAARDAFLMLTADERTELLAFVEDL
ncbi:MAG: di-heme oxidoredictase family protein [Myxococcota bacterium]